MKKLQLVLVYKVAENARIRKHCITGQLTIYQSFKNPMTDMSVCEGDTYLIFFGPKILRVQFLFDQNICILLLKFFKLKLVAFESAKEIKKERKTYLWF